MKQWSKRSLGLLLCLAVAIPCWLLGKAVPVVGGPVFAILAGMVIALFYREKKRTQAGIAYTSKKILQLRSGAAGLRHEPVGGRPRWA